MKMGQDAIWVITKRIQTDREGSSYTVYAAYLYRSFSLPYPGLPKYLSKPCKASSLFNDWKEASQGEVTILKKAEMSRCLFHTVPSYLPFETMQLYLVFNRRPLYRRQYASVTRARSLPMLNEMYLPRVIM